MLYLLGHVLALLTRNLPTSRCLSSSISSTGTSCSSTSTSIRRLCSLANLLVDRVANLVRIFLVTSVEMDDQQQTCSLTVLQTGLLTVLHTWEENICIFVFIFVSLYFFAFVFVFRSARENQKSWNPTQWRFWNITSSSTVVHFCSFTVSHWKQ